MKKAPLSQGFTLIELMVTLSVIAILSAIAAPSFMTIIRDNRLATQANELVGSIQYARTEAAKQGVQVTIRSNSAINSQWEQGWIVFTDWDGDGIWDDDGDGNPCELEEDCILKSQQALSFNNTMRTGGNYTQWFAYLPSGLSISSGGLGNDTFKLCSPLGDNTNSRSIVVNTTGRPQTSKGTASCP